MYRFDSSPAFARALHEGAQELQLPPGESVTDGEIVLAIFEVGAKRRATAASARGLVRGPPSPPVLAFERRDWERLTDFAAAGSATMAAAAPVALGPRVLLVAADEDLRNSVTPMLHASGFEVEVVTGAEAALSSILADRCDVVVIDWMLSDLSAIELCRAIRQHLRQASLPIMCLSAKSSSQDVVDAFAGGADDFVSKPFRGPELGARIFNLLRRARRTTASQ